MLNLLSKEVYEPKYHIFKDAPIIDKDIIKILMIDDSQKDINIVHELLQYELNLKIEFVGYTNTKDALYVLQNVYLPDVIMLDLSMPCINGKMLLKHLKTIAKIKTIPIVIHSSMNNYENIIKANHLEAHAFFSKPLSVEGFERFLLNSWQ